MAIPIRRIEDPTKKPVLPEPEEPILDIFKDVPVDDRESTIAPAITSRETSLPAFLWPVVGIIAGLGMILFGVWNSGSFYMTGTRLSGTLATIFYIWQVGTIFQITGAIFVYNSIIYLWSIRNGE